MADKKKPTVHVIGAGPAGLTAGLELTLHNYPIILFEKSGKVGGIARTEEYRGSRFDIGGHRFYTKIDEIQKLWEDALGEKFIKVRRLSRIYYLGNFFRYPINPWQVFRTLGLIESIRILSSYLLAKVFPSKEEENFEQWVSNRFGRRLYEMFFKTYTEKVWGIPCNQIRAEWAAQRIMDLSIGSSIRNAILGDTSVKSLIDEFYYPTRGPGMMWEAFSQRIRENGGLLQNNAEVTSLRHDGERIVSVGVSSQDGLQESPAENVISSMPVDELVRMLVPAPPPDVLKAADQLRYRAFVLVGLVIDGRLFPDNWIYIHSPDFKVGRIQNFKNWSAEMVSDPTLSNIGMEYFCSEGDALWTTPDDALVKLATQELIDLGLLGNEKVVDSVVFRQEKAYPVYDSDYRKNLDIIQGYIAKFDNLQTVGRNGMFRYNNQDHSMLTGLLAARNILGESHDLWDVNTERSYHEDFVK